MAVTDLGTPDVGPDGGAATDMMVDMAPPSTQFWVDVAGGDDHGCALAESGSVYCWGQNTNGQLGTGNTNDSLIPALVLGANRYVEIDAGGQHTCAIDDVGAVWCWGEGNHFGFSGNQTAPLLVNPGPVKKLMQLTAKVMTRTAYWV